MTRAVLVMVVWLGVAMAAGAAGVFHTGPDAPPVALGVAAAGPPLVVVGLLAWSVSFRDWVRGLDLHLLTMLQSWRIAGFALLALWGVGELPAGFALPAGIGDVIVGITAPAVALVVVGRSRMVFYGWTFFGIADLVNAVTLGVLHSTSPIGVLADPAVSTDVMRDLPVSLIPTFGVPLTLVLHAVSLANAAHSDLFEGTTVPSGPAVTGARP
jgi:hypothetical protein